MLKRAVFLSALSVCAQPVFADSDNVGVLLRGIDRDGVEGQAVTGVATDTQEGLSISPETSEHESVTDAPGIEMQGTTVNENRAVEVGGPATFTIEVHNTGL